MNSPLGFLGPAIELIGRNASVLPATGGAFEDMARSGLQDEGTVIERLTMRSDISDTAFSQ